MTRDDTIRLQLDPSPTNARNSEAVFVTLKSGRIVLAWSKFTGTDFSDFGAAVIATRYSDDGGLTWSDTDQGCGWNQWQSFSEDQGQVWSPPEPSPFVSCCSPLSAKRIPATGDLFAVWNDHSGRFKTPKPEPISWGRTPLVCAVSRDEGKTWGDFKLLESAADHGFCYVAIHFTDDAVLLSYNAGGATTNTPLDTQRVRRIPLDVLYGR